MFECDEKTIIFFCPLNTFEPWNKTETTTAVNKITYDFSELCQLYIKARKVVAADSEHIIWFGRAFIIFKHR